MKWIYEPLEMLGALVCAGGLAGLAGGLVGDSGITWMRVMAGLAAGGYIVCWWASKRNAPADR